MPAGSHLAPPPSLVRLVLEADIDAGAVSGQAFLVGQLTDVVCGGGQFGGRVVDDAASTQKIVGA